MFAPDGDSSQPRAPQFRTTVIQDVVWKEGFVDLCRSSRCASKAPGQPPVKASRSVFDFWQDQFPCLAWQGLLVVLGVTDQYRRDAHGDDHA